MKTVFVTVVIGSLLLAAGCSCQSKARLEKITGLYHAGKHDAALEAIKKYTADYPDDDMGWTLQGNMLDEIGQLDRAREAHEKALSINADSFQSLTSMGVIFRKEGDYDQAKLYYEKAIRLNPHYAQAYSSLSVIELKRNNDAKALEYARKAFELDKTDPVVVANLAVACHYNGLKDERDTYTGLAESLGYHGIVTLQQLYRGELTIRD